MKVKEIQDGVGSSKSESDIAKRGSDIALKTNVPLSIPAKTGSTTIEIVPAAIGITIDDGGTQFKSPHDDVM